ncbi:MAG: hypothetical protein JSS27_11060 [Planctomycetes bacterium]|nr:hypothetical protein [Planctomycetota bacterium]
MDQLQPSSKSVIPTVFGALNIVMGLLGLLGAAVGIASLFFWDVLKNDPSIKIMRASAVLRVFGITVPVLSLLASIALLAAGVGLFQMRDWGRRVTIGVAWYDIAKTVLTLVLYTPLFWVPLYEHAQTVEDRAQRFGLIGGIFGGIIGIFIALIFPVCALYFLTRPNVIATLEGARDPGAGYARPETGNPYQSP